MEDSKTRKSLALDVRTYNMLQKICSHQERSKIGQLKVLIEKEYEFIFGSGHSERVQAHLDKRRS
tara:strand:+ start:820 stop:1014 length:195 start_codon:yes stop_codon:yes gene_type:complete